MENVKLAYRERITHLQQKLAVRVKNKKRLGSVRLVSFLAAILFFFIFLSINGLLASVCAVVLIIVFAIVTKKDIENTKKLRFIEQLIQINKEELKALEGDILSFNSGVEFMDNEHPYTGDLDIFGKHSIFQMLNRTTTGRSTEKLAGWLKYPETKEVIDQRQKSVKALAEAVEWRQDLQAIGRNDKIKESNFEQILAWAKSKPENENLKKWNVLTSVALSMTVIFILLASFGLASWQLLWISLIVHSWIIWRSGKIVMPHYALLSKTVASLAALEKSLYLISNKEFKDPGLKALQKDLDSGQALRGMKAYEVIESLRKIMAQLDLRYNPLVHFPLNLLLFWDWHQYRALSSMHRKVGEKLLKWADVYVEIEALCSLANMAYNNRDWDFPEIKEQHFTFEAIQLGHPLIVSKKRVCSDVELGGVGKMMLITGSNMAGKSTFLRSVGVNVVLAMAGAPVCAKKMSLSPVKVISSMRIADNLEENISTFYAELKKLEYIIAEAKKKGRNLLLMDEILRGTNSNDRHAGSRALIEQLLKVDAVGILATHDLALTDLEEKYPQQVFNYHFDVQVQKEVLFFDYALKHGICTSMNASILMRKIGIEV